MTDNHQDLKALIKREAPEAIWTHCKLYRDAIASKELSIKLNEVYNSFSKSHHILFPILQRRNSNLLLYLSVYPLQSWPDGAN